MRPFAAFCLGPSDLFPSPPWLEFLRVSSGENLERRIRMTLEVDVTLRMLMREPIWGNKVGHENATDLVAILVVFDWIADLPRPKGPMRILVGAVEPRIHRHLANLVSRADAKTCLVGKDALYENLGDRKPFVSEIVIGERVGLVAVV